MSRTDSAQTTYNPAEQEMNMHTFGSNHLQLTRTGDSAQLYLQLTRTGETCIRSAQTTYNLPEREKHAYVRLKPPTTYPNGRFGSTIPTTYPNGRNIHTFGSNHLQLTRTGETCIRSAQTTYNLPEREIRLNYTYNLPEREKHAYVRLKPPTTYPNGRNMHTFGSNHLQLTRTGETCIRSAQTTYNLPEREIRLNYTYNLPEREKHAYVRLKPPTTYPNGRNIHTFGSNHLQLTRTRDSNICDKAEN
ncbi:unnamed protein product [Orchesella dallaii]|uniref:Aldose 1-epimerase n=1 Tax=Orchesella dallaii TaxID=48710 RepID=A0ABP1QSY5_9HEXA